MQSKSMKSLVAAFALSALPLLTRAQQKFEFTPQQGDVINIVINSQSVTPRPIPRDSLPVNVVSENGVRISYNELTKTVLRHTDFLFCADTDHRNEDITDLFYSAQMLDIYKQQGVSTVMAELDSTFVYYFKEDLQDYSVLKKELQSAGFKPETVKKLDDGFYKYFIHMHDVSDAGMTFVGVDPHTNRFKKYFLKLTDNASDEEQLKAIDYRLKADTALIDIIKKNLPDSGKTILVYGAWHGARFGDGLLEDPAVPMIKIEPYPDIETYSKTVAETLKTKAGMKSVLGKADESLGDDLPHLIYIINEGKVYFSSKASQELIVAVKAAAAIERMQTTYPDREFRH